MEALQLISTRAIDLTIIRGHSCQNFQQAATSIYEVLQKCYTYQNQSHCLLNKSDAGARTSGFHIIKISVCDHDPLDISKDGHKDEDSFHYAGVVNHTVQHGLKERNNTGIQWRNRVEEQQPEDTLFVVKEVVMNWNSLYIYNEIDVDWDSPPIYNIYCDDEYSDGNHVVINGDLIGKVEVDCKESMRVAQQKKFVDLGYVGPFDYKSATFTNVEVFKDYMDTTHVDEGSLSFAAHYSKSQWKRNKLLIDVFYAKFNMEELMLISRIVIHVK
ncbi:unnamed protein product [Dovyalis caffra]|uniref:Uncharacterized protein n=1 Tax=Dovyalis caffra TaxID=77055 RepID=A0AAV1RC82_9ROSI|nr:unnamed protein product [Dovyalis caffra]